MLDYLSEFMSKTFTSVNIPNVQISDIFEILIISIIIYWITKRIIDTRLFNVVKGIIILLLVYGILVMTHLDVLASIFQWFMILCIICIILACQPEIKKIMESAGSKNYIQALIKWWKKDRTNEEQLEFSNDTLNALVDACEIMSKAKTGALIVFELDAPLKDIVATGIKLDAIITKQLLVQIFEKNTPLHDGAVVIKHDRIESATCYLPLSNNMSIDKDLGTRHRAGIGVTEQVDCFVLIVSEETGGISYVQNGNIRSKVSLKELRAMLGRVQHRKSPVKKNPFESVKAMKFKNIKTKITAIIGGILVWFAVISIIDPVTTKRISGINIDVINGNIITSSEQTYETIDSDPISVIVKGRRSVLDKISASDIKAQADISEMSQVFSVPITVEIASNYSEDIEITYQSNSNIKIAIDSISETVVRVDIEQTGKIAEGTYISNMSNTPESVTIKGANALVSTIDRVVLPVDVTNRRRSFVTTVQPIVYDRNGDEIDISKLELNEDTFSVDVEMLNTKTVELNINIINDESDFRVVSYEVEKDEITIGADDDLLAETSEINIDVDIADDISNISANKLIKTIDINEYLDTGLVVASTNSKLTISVDVETPVEKDITVDVNNIEIKNISSKVDCSIVSDNVTFKIKGYEQDLNRISQDSFDFDIDLNSSKEESGTVQLNAKLKDIEENQGLSIEIEDLPLINYELSK